MGFRTYERAEHDEQGAPHASLYEAAPAFSLTCCDALAVSSSHSLCVGTLTYPGSFYKHIGFRTYERAKHDEQGAPHASLYEAVTSLMHIRFSI